MIHHLNLNINEYICYMMPMMMKDDYNRSIP